jgi:hypothetical protein
MPKPIRRVVGLAVIVSALAACGSEGTPTTAEEETPAPPVFDVGAVQANFTDECKEPVVVDELFCEQVKIPQMSADGTILIVPTTLDPAVDERGDVICDQLALAHFDADGKDLGYDVIGIKDMNGGNLAACTVDR